MAGDDRGRAGLGAVAMVVGVWAGLGLVATAGSYLLALLEAQPGTLGQAFLRQMPRWVGWALLTPLVLWLGRRVPFDRRPRWIPVLFHLGAGTAVAVLHTAFTAGGLIVSFPETAARVGRLNWFLAFLGAELHFALLGYGAILAAGFTFDYHRRLRERELREARLETQLARARLEALEGRLHPHFLFNALHAIRVLVDEDPAAATKAVARLGEVLRLTLERSHAQEVPLEEEIEHLRPYLEIEEIRFQDRLQVEIEVEDGARAARVPGFLLQPLVENAVRHGIGRRSGSGRIELRARVEDADRAGAGELVVGVVNTTERPPPPPERWTEGLGLSTTRERLARLYGDRARLEIDVRGGRTRVAVRIPYRIPDSGTPEATEGEREVAGSTRAPAGGARAPAGDTRKAAGSEREAADG